MLELDKYQSAIILACKGWPTKNWSEEFQNKLPELPNFQNGRTEYFIVDYSKIIMACSDISGVAPEYLSMRDFNHWLLYCVKACESQLNLESILREIVFTNDKSHTAAVSSFIILRSFLAHTLMVNHNEQQLISFNYELMQHDKNERKKD